MDVYPNCMKSIGIKETLAYLDGVYDKKILIEKITTNTARLAKRQTTFNNSQFGENVIKGSVGKVGEDIVIVVGTPEDWCTSLFPGKINIHSH